MPEHFQIKLIIDYLPLDKNPTYTDLQTQYEFEFSEITTTELTQTSGLDPLPTWLLKNVTALEHFKELIPARYQFTSPGWSEAIVD